MVKPFIVPRHRSAWLVVATLFLMAALAGVVPLLVAVGAADAVKIRVSPITSFEPATVLVQVLVPRDADNRSIRVSAESFDYFVSSEVQLDGEESPAVRSITFRELPAGSYELRGVLVGGSGKVKGIARASVIVVPR